MNTHENVATLFTITSRAVVVDLNKFGENIKSLTPNIKDQCLKLMSRRGLLTDENIELVVHDKVKKVELNLCENITDNTLSKLRKCSYLAKIDLNTSVPETRTGITSAGIVNLSRSCPHLQVVFLRKCSNITDDGIIALAMNCPRLRHLNLHGCNQLTDRSIVALGENLTYLSSLNISAAQVSDNGIFMLVSGNCSQTLKELDFSKCVHLTDEAVEAVTQYCPQIAILIFDGCPKMTEQARMALEERDGPQMKHVTWTIY